MEKKILTLTEAAEYLGVSKRYMYHLTHSRLIPFSKPTNKLMYFKRTDLEDWMLSNRVDSDEFVRNQAATLLATRI